MDRRAWLFGCMAIAAAGRPRMAQARPVIAVLNGAMADGMRDLVEELHGGLAELGRGRPRCRIAVPLRRRPARTSARLLDELLRLRPAVLVAVGPRPVMVARDARVALPVVAVHIDDPGGDGHCADGGAPGRLVHRHLGRLRRHPAAALAAAGRPRARFARRLAVLMNPQTVRPRAIRETLEPLEATLGRSSWSRPAAPHRSRRGVQDAGPRARQRPGGAGRRPVLGFAPRHRRTLPGDEAAVGVGRPRLPRCRRRGLVPGRCSCAVPPFDGADRQDPQGHAAGRDPVRAGHRSSNS